jgi:hypothetical protein
MVKKGLDKKYPEAMTCSVDAKLANGEYVWQMPWSELLHIGVIINPPYEAICLMDYFGPTGKGPNKKGTKISQTPHARGTAFNIGGGNGVDDEAAVVQTALNDHLPGLRDFLKERENNAIHCNCLKV